MANPRGSKREKINSTLARSVAAESMVLLKNEGVLPLVSDSGAVKTAIFGIGQIYTFKGGTGSGDVNNVRTVSILDGLTSCPALAVDKEIAAKYRLWTVTHPMDTVEEHMQLKAFSNREMPLDPTDIEAAAKRCDAAVIVISRISGEFLDRSLAKGDYELQDEEKRLIENVTSCFEKNIVILNTAGVIDTQIIRQRASAILYISLPGQEAGNALADVLTGAVNPSGKLAATWADSYSDYGSAENFGTSVKNGNITCCGMMGMPGTPSEQSAVYYSDDIYVGYRWFDTFNKIPAFPFGFGLSYTEFEILETSVAYNMGTVTVKATVSNSGDKYPGREVVQVYISAPDGELEKPLAELRGFKKTKLLVPGEKETVEIEIPVTGLASFSQARSAYIIEKGIYYIRIGTSSRNTFIAGALDIDGTVETLKVKDLMGCPPDDLKPVLKANAVPYTYACEADEMESAKALAIKIASKYIESHIVKYTSSPEPEPVPEIYSKPITLSEVKSGERTLDELVGQFSTEDLAKLCCGTGMDLSGLPENIGGALLGDSVSLPVPGAAGATAEFPEHGIGRIILADGPAGIRIRQKVPETEDRPAFRQNCTAFPVGTLLACSWDPELIEKTGSAVSLEMEEYGIHLWLAPGMNIQRNPLCGRNFEYFSEDPLIAGICAAAVTRGVQKNGRGVTVKHFAGNNQEDDRTNMTDYISQRALREIYLKGFEIAVKTAHPFAIMTSYNDINGVPSADNFDLCTAIARDEWGFDGLIMTDWGGGVSTPALSMYAGNDLIQPGGKWDAEAITAAVKKAVPVRSNGEVHYEKVITKAMLQRSAKHILNVVMRLI